MPFIRNIFVCLISVFSLGLQTHATCTHEITSVAKGRSTLLGKIVKITLHKRALDPKFRKFFEFTGEVTRVDESPVFSPISHADSDDYLFPSRYQTDRYIIKIIFNGQARILAVPDGYRGAVGTITEAAKIIPITGDMYYDYEKFNEYLSVFDPISP